MQDHTLKCRKLSVVQHSVQLSKYICMYVCMMASFDMEPIFCKALKFLHSSSKDSANEIMHLLEEVLEQKYGGTKSLNLKSGTLVEEASKPAETQKSGRPSRGPSPVQNVSTGPTSEKTSRDSSPPSEPVSSRTSPDIDDGDLALEIFEDDLNCKICKGMSVGPRNRLVECSDCHMLYHQECHKPPISENVNDPRLVWYCSSCSKKNQEKVQPKIKTVPPESANKKGKTELTSEIKNPLFKRSEKSSSSSSSSSHSKNSSGNGMAHLAASLQASKASSSSLSSKHHPPSSSANKGSPSLTYSKTPSSPNPKPQSGSAPAPANIIAADKRLQNMKKKAAAKMQEKRSKHK